MAESWGRSTALAMLFGMYRIRMVEEAIANRYVEQQMRCPVHLSVGQECVPTAVSEALMPGDLAVSAHRSHAHYLAKGGNLRAMLAELYGKVTGCARGRGGSMHLIDGDAGLVAAVPIVGSAISIGVGVAWAQKFRSSESVVVVYLGDGATEEGVFGESLDFALLHDLRVLFVVENNYYSVYTHLRDRQSERRRIADLARGHGLEAFVEDGNDALKTYALARNAVQHVRDSGQPLLLEFETYRWLEHCGPNSDDQLNYRDPEEVREWLSRDPIRGLESILVSEGALSEVMLKARLSAIQLEIDEAMHFAISSAFPDEGELLEGVYA